MKGLLCSRGYSLYQEIWNDQPPLHTALLAGLFKLFGPSAFVGRLLAVAFASILVGAFYQLIRRQSGHFAAVLSVLLLVSSSLFMQLSVSVMIELPAMALALAATLALFVYFEQRRNRWLVCSGVLLGCALQTKLTAAIFFPALLLQWLVAGPWNQTTMKNKNAARRGQAATDGIHRDSDDSEKKAERGGTRPGRTSRALITWLVVVALAFGVIAWLSPGESLDLLWNSHAAAGAALENSDRYAFKPGILWNDYDCLIPALAGIGVILWQRRWSLLFPVVLFGTVFLIHSFHRPYWYYYGLHFEIPMAWLAGVGIQKLFSFVWHCEPSDFRTPPFKPVLALLLWSGLLALAAAGLPEKLQRGLASISDGENAQENPIVRQLKEFRTKTRWVFTDRVIYAFHAGLPVPPELAVIPSKRVWSGRITSAQVLESLRKYRPEQVVLFGAQKRDEQLKDYIDANYVVLRPGPSEAFHGGAETHWVLKGLLNHEIDEIYERR